MVEHREQLFLATVPGSSAVLERQLSLPVSTMSQ
jgi:hypothetical protein